MKAGNKKGSVLIVTLIILGIALVSALSASIISIKERQSSIGESESGLAIQNAQAGVENVMRDIVNDGHINTSELSGCGTGGFIWENPGDTTISTYKVELKSDNGSTVNCSTGLISDVYWMKSIGIGSGSQRAIEASVCGANMDRDLVGHWPFRNNADDTVAGNDAILQSYANGVGVALSVPTFESNVGSGVGSDKVHAGAIHFNIGGGSRNLAQINDSISYRVQNGTISFWFRYDAVTMGNHIFAKDMSGNYTKQCANDNGGWTWDAGLKDWVNNTCKNSICNDSSSNNYCDAGHLAFAWRKGTAAGVDVTDTTNGRTRTYSNFGMRFQNDGNGGTGMYYPLMNYNGTLSGVPIAANQWHLATVTFDNHAYNYYIDAKLVDTFTSSNDIDSNLEGMLGNASKIWLGQDYNPSGSGNKDATIIGCTAAGTCYTQANTQTAATLCNGGAVGCNSFRGYMGDLRIYNRALQACEVIRLYNTTNN